jgi:hypothetical protein
MIFLHQHELIHVYVWYGVDFAASVFVYLQRPDMMYESVLLMFLLFVLGWGEGGCCGGGGGHKKHGNGRFW